jgi:hypothetical protein
MAKRAPHCAALECRLELSDFVGTAVRRARLSGGSLRAHPMQAAGAAVQRNARHMRTAAVRQFPTDLRPAPFIKVLAAFGAISEIAFPVMLALGSNVGHSVGVAGLLVRE